jgi:CO dehydrogenase/acetyl-CoA synthase delta subunit
MPFDNPSLETRVLELQTMNSSMQQMILAQVETIKIQNQTIQNQNLQIQGMQTQLMTVIQMSQRDSPLSLELDGEPEPSEDDGDLEPIAFPDILSSIPIDQGDDNGDDFD